jgi:hypothetical protein
MRTMPYLVTGERRLEADLSDELHQAKREAAFALERVLARLRTRRVDRNEYETARTCWLHRECIDFDGALPPRHTNTHSR